MKRYSVLYKYFITYTAIILAVCVIASFSFFFVAFSQYNENIEESNIARFNVSKETLDSYFEESIFIARKIVTSGFTSYNNPTYKKMDTAMQIKATLQDYLTNSGKFLDIVLIPDMTKGIDISYYNTTGIVNYKYFDNYYGFDKITHQWIVENIENITAPLLVQTISKGTMGVEKEVDVLLIPTELFITNGKFDAVMFLFDNENMMQQLTGSFADGTANAMIVSSDEKILVADSTIAHNYDLFSKTKPKNKKVYKDKSTIFDWNYVLFVDESVFGGYLGSKGFSIILCISLILIIIGIVMAFVAARYSYRPIKGIMNIFPKEFSTEENEFSIMKRIFDEMNAKNELLMESLEGIKGKKLDPLATLLTGNNVDSKTLAFDLGLPSDATGYVLGIFEVDNYKKIQESAEANAAKDLCKCIRESIKLPTFVEELPGKGFYLTLSAINNEYAINRDVLKKMIEDAQENIKTMLDVTVTCTLSHTFYNVADAAEIVYSVICATNYRIMYGYDSIIDMELLDKNYVTIDTGFFNAFFDFYNNLKSGDHNSVMSNLMSMKKTIKESFSPDIFRLAYINIVNCFAQYLGDSEIQFELTSIPKTVDSAFEDIESLTNKFFEMQSRNTRLKSEILRIVQSEYTNSNLSISLISEKLDISSSFLRKYFKDNMGITLFAYIDEMRISYAKQLLFETTMPIKDIAKASGYNDINNFNRKFKAKTGKTPSEYRNAK